MTRVLYPGSFDPVHNGHLELIEVAASLFDEVVVAAMRNPQKGQRPVRPRRAPGHDRRIARRTSPTSRSRFSNLVVDLAKELEADFIVKGLRAVSDFESELQQAQMNLASPGSTPCSSRRPRPIRSSPRSGSVRSPASAVM